MKLVRSAILVTAAVALPLMPTAAQANTWRHNDAANDVVSFTDSSTTATPEPTRTNGDVLAVTVRHARTKVIARVRYQDMANADGFNGHLFSFKSNQLRRDVVVVTASGIRAQVITTKPNGKRVSCRVKRSLDYTLHTLTVKVPRSCLGNPRWVKVGMASVFMTGLGTGATQYVDDALTSGGVSPTGPRYSRKVFR